MISKQQLATVTEVLATTSVIGIGWALGGTVGAAIMAGIGINLGSDIIQKGSTYLKEKWLIAEYGVLNHDIQRALARALVKALISLEERYFELPETDARPREMKDAIRELFKELREVAPTVFAHSVEKVATEHEIKEYLYGKVEDARVKLWERLEGTNLIYTYYGEHFKNFLRDNITDELVFWFGEELKTDNRESNKAWRAFQRLLLEGIRADVNNIHADQELIRKDLQVLVQIQERLDEISAVVGHRTADEPFEDALDKALDTLNLLVDSVHRTERKVDGVVATTERTELKIDTVISALKPEPKTKRRKLPKDIQKIIDEGWDLLEAGKLAEAKGLFKNAASVAVDRNDSLAIAGTKYYEAVLLNEFERDALAAEPILVECLNTYREAKSELDVADVLRQFGLVEIGKGDFDQANAYTSQALAIYRAHESKTGIGDSLRQLGWICHARGNLSQAIDLYDESLALALELHQTGDSQRRKGEAQAIAACYAHKAMVYEAGGRVIEAELALTRALEWQRKSGFKSETAKALLLLAQFKCREGQLEAGIECLNEAGRLYQEIGDQTWLARCFDLLGRIYFTDGETDQAIDAFKSALHAVQKSGDADDEERYLNKLGQLYLSLRKVSDAREYFEQARDLSLREKSLDGYAAAVRCLAEIAENEGAQADRDVLLKDGVLALQKLLLSTQREPQRAGILGQIGHFYLLMENYQEALSYFHREKKAWELLSNLHGIAGALGGIAWAKRKLGKTNEEFDIYRELKKLVDGSPYYDLIAGAANNLASFEMDQGNLNDAQRLLEEAEFYSRKYKLPHLRGVLRNQEILDAEVKKIRPPELSFDELIHDLFTFLGYYPESRDSLFRFWFFEKGGDLYSNYRSMFGVKFMVCEDDVDRFLETSASLGSYADLSLQSVGSKFPGTITEWFEYPAERHFPAFFSIGAIPKDTPKDVVPEIDFSKLETRYLAIPTEPNPIRSKATGMEGVLVFGWSVGLPGQAHTLILSRTPEELIRAKVFFLPYERHLASDELLSVLGFGKDLGLIPIYRKALPRSEAVALLHTANINLPIFTKDEDSEQSVVDIKRALLRLVSTTKAAAQTELENLIFECGKLTSKVVGRQVMPTQVNVLEFPKGPEKHLHVALVIPDHSLDQVICDTSGQT